MAHYSQYYREQTNIIFHYIVLSMEKYLRTLSKRDWRKVHNTVTRRNYTVLRGNRNNATT